MRQLNAIKAAWRPFALGVATGVVATLVVELIFGAIARVQRLISPPKVIVELRVDHTGEDGPHYNSASTLVTAALTRLQHGSLPRSTVRRVEFVSPEGENQRPLFENNFYFCRTFVRQAPNDVELLREFANEFDRCIAKREGGETLTLWLDEDSAYLDLVEVDHGRFAFCDCSADVVSNFRPAQLD